MNYIYKLESLMTRHYRNKIKKKYLQNKLIPAPTFVLWDCTRRCNLNCEHCGASKEKYDSELNTKDVKDLIDILAINKVRFFSVTGGEPLLRKDLLEILSYANNKGIKTGIASNGFFIDAKMAEKIKNSGIYSVQISLDGLENTHNNIRKNDMSFQKASEAIKLLQKEKIPVIQVATTITKSNIHELNQIKNHLLSLGVKMWRISPIMPIGRAESKKLLLDKEQFKDLFNFIINNKEPINIHIAEILPYLDKFEEKIRDSPNVCPVGITACSIGVTGNIRGCAEQPDIPEFIEGNILKDDFMDVWRKKFKKYRVNSILNEDKRCSQCKSKYRCYGGCWVMRKGNTQCIYDLI